MKGIVIPTHLNRVKDVYIKLYKSKNGTFQVFDKKSLLKINFEVSDNLLKNFYDTMVPVDQKFYINLNIFSKG